MRATAHQIRRSPLAVRAWWSLTAAAMVLGLLSVFFGTPAGAQDESEDPSEGAVVVDRVDARSDLVVAEGSTTAGPVSSITLSSRGKPVEIDSISGIGDGLRNDVVAVLDNTSTLGNATVQLAKQGLAPLMPGAGAVATLGVVSTGGGASIEAGPTSSADEVATALAGIHPAGAASHTWQGLSRASALLADRPAGSVGTVVLFSAAAETLDPVAMSRARSDLLRENIRLDVVALPAGTDLTSLSDMVDDLGGSMQVVDSDEDLAGAYESVSAAMAGRFQVTFESPEAVNGMVPLTVTSGDVSSALAYSEGAVRVGASALAPMTGGGSGGIFANSLVKWFALLLGITAAMLIVWSIAMMVLPDENNLTNRLQVYEESYGAVDEPAQSEESAVSVPIIKKAVEFTGEMAERRGVLDKVEVMLERANLPLRAPEAMFFTGVLAAIVVLLAFFLTGNILIAIAVAVLVALVPSSILNFKIRGRQKAFQRQLPDMLTLLAGTLKAGYSISQGFESVSTEVADPMGRELRRVVTETRLGRSLEESLEAVAVRMDSDDFSWAVMAIRIQREVGGNLAELLLTVADTMTQRERLRREVSTLTAEGKMSAIIIGFLPPGLAGVMFVLNPSYIGELFTPGLGMAMLLGAGVMMAIGFAWMKKTITIEV